MPACPQCSEMLPDGVRFCTQCGSPASPLSPLTPSRKTGGPAPDLPPRYQMVKFLGRGGMGRVFLCRDTRLQVDVAIKVLPPEVAADEESLAQIEREARAAAKFRDCPGILSLYGFEQHNDTWYLVMEYAAGGSLYDRLKKDGALPEADCRRLAAEVAESLAFAHDRRILHRDIKPANVLVDAEGRTKIADFGIAKVMSETSSKMSTVTVAGTPIYMAPEIVLQKRVDHRTDLYSLGCMLFEMATGKRPFGGSYAEVAMAKVGPDSRAPDPRAVNPGLSEELTAIIQRLLCPDPEGRYANGRECAAALRGTALPADQLGTPVPFATGGAGPVSTGRHSAATLTAPPRPAAGKAGGGRRVAWIAGGVGLAAAAGGALFLFAGGREAPTPVPPAGPPAAASGVSGSAPAPGAGGPTTPSPQPPPAAVPVVADLLVRTRPAGARVAVDGVDRGTAGDAGLRVAGVDPVASHRVAATLVDYETREDTVEPWDRKGEWSVTLALPRQMGTLEVLDVPPGSEITAIPRTGDAASLAVSDGRASLDLKTGEYEVRILVSGRPPESRTVVLRRNETTTVRVTARPVGASSLTIDTDTPGAEVLVDGKRLGVTPLRDVQVLPGTHTIQVLHPERDAMPPFEVRVEEGEKKVVPSIVLPGADLDLTALPEGATARMDGRPVRGVVRTRSGMAEVVITRPGYRDQTVTVLLRAGQKVPPAVEEWVPSPGSLDLSALPPDAVVTVDGNPATRGGPMEIAPGSHTVLVTRNGFKGQEPRTVVVKGGETVAIENPQWEAVLAPVVPGLPAPPPSAVPSGALPPGTRLLDGRLVWEKDRAEMVLIPGGIYSMGSARSAGDANARPLHTVTIGALLMDRHEVTNAQYDAFVAATAYRTDAEKRGLAITVDERMVVHEEGVSGADWRHTAGPGSSLKGRELYPVVCVSWNDAQAYAAWAGKRLPTEAEFERALRGGVFQKDLAWGAGTVPDRKFANLADESSMRATAGSNPKFAWFAGYDDGFPGLSPAGSFPQNPYGLFDTLGNAQEWCRDYYDPAYYATLPPRGPNVDVHGPERGTTRVVRGSSFCGGPPKAHSYFREGFPQDAAMGFVGFRCVADAAQR